LAGAFLLLLAHEFADAIFYIFAAERPDGALILGFFEAQYLDWHALLVE
jgi:hypothetical protein